jgi:hypothetical protein
VEDNVLAMAAVHIKQTDIAAYGQFLKKLAE